MRRFLQGLKEAAEEVCGKPQLSGESFAGFLYEETKMKNTTNMGDSRWRRADHPGE